MSKSKVSLLLHSNVGKKAIMAATGFVLVGFVLTHMLANLQIFAGPDQLNGYARGLREAPVLLWAVRALLAVAFTAHVVIAVQLTMVKRAARPVGYRQRQPRDPALAPRSMLFSGVLLLVFLLVHLANLTWGNLHPRFVHLDAYGNVVALFGIVPVGIYYVLSVFTLGVHVAHGAWSMFQSLGLNTIETSPGLKRAAKVLSAVTVAGMSAVVVAVLTGIVR
jgi:succinate dehydrogenase / fumarate reductase cytochrome b subunit